MDYLIIGLIIAVLGTVLYANFFQRKEAGATDSSSVLLMEDLRRQIGEATQIANTERLAKTEALTRVAGADAAKNAAEKQLREAVETHQHALGQLRKDHQQVQTEATERYSRDLVELKTSFSKMSTDVLKGMAPDVTKEVANNVAPLIEKVNTALETYRKGMQQSLMGQDEALAQVREQMAKITETTTALAASTNDFTAVLKSSQHRGKWGEQTLRRVVEVSGLSEHCDFVEQSTQDDTRPDLIITLPGDRAVIIDSKVPEFDVALANQSAPNRKELVTAHAAKLRATIKELARKDYPEAQRKAGRTAFDKVILFLPAESLLSTALEGDTDLIIFAGREGILLATPATLMGFLSAINLTWIQHKQAAESKDLIDKATALYKSVADFAEHIADVRDSMNKSVTKLNASFGSFESRVRPKGDELIALHKLQPSKLLPSKDDLAKIVETVRDLNPPST